METKYNYVIFFDGVCGLCNGFVDFILSVDKKSQFLFSPLQGEYAKTILPPEMIQDLKSVVFLKDGNVYTKSKAVIQILNDLGGIWKIVNLGKALPLPLLNKTYELVAENRYKMFGKRESCRFPTPDERSRFIQ